MAANDTAALVVALSAQLTQFEKDMNKAVGIADQKTRQIENSFSKINPSAEGIAGFFDKLGAAGAGASMLAVAAALKEVTHEVASLGESAARVGLTTEQFQKFRFAIIATGGDANVADSFLNRFSRTISDAGQGTGILYKTLQLNHVALRDVNGQLLPASVLLDKFANLVKNTKSPQDQLNLAMAVGGREAGPALVAALKNGSEGLREFGDAADAAGVVLDDALIKKAQEINRRWDILWQKIVTGAKKLGVDLAEEADKTVETTKQEANLIGTAFKSMWDIVLNYFETHSPRFTQLKEDIKELFDEEQRITARTSQRRGADITSPMVGAVDKRLDPAPASIDKITKLYNEQDDAFRKLIQRMQQRVELAGVEALAVGKTVGETERLKSAVELENQAKVQNIPLTEARRKKILEEAAAIGAATQALEKAKVAGEIKFGAGTALLTPEDVAIAQRLKGVYGDDIPAALASSEAAAMRLNNAFSEFGNMSRDTLKGMATDIRTSLQAGATAWQAFANAGVNALNKISDKLMSMAIDNLWSKALGPAFASIMGSIFAPSTGVLPGGLPLGQGGIGHAASGVDNWGGGPIMVGEHGPEILNLPSGSQVIPKAVKGSGTSVNFAPTTNISIGANAGVSEAQVERIVAMNNVRLAKQFKTATPEIQRSYSQLEG